MIHIERSYPKYILCSRYINDLNGGRAYLAKSLRTTHITTNINARPPIMPNSVGSTYEPMVLSGLFALSAKNINKIVHVLFYSFARICMSYCCTGKCSKKGFYDKPRKIHFFAKMFTYVDTTIGGHLKRT